MTNQITTSIIIPCLNAAETIAEQLDAVTGQVHTAPWEVIVADNGSTDGSQVIVRRYMARIPNLKLIDASQHRGAPYALNQGVRASRGEQLLFIDADDVVADGWLAAMATALSQHDCVAARFDTERLNPPWLAHSHKNRQQDSLQPYVYPPYLPHVGGGSLGVRRVAFDRLGGFDEALPILYDTSFCWQLQLQGYTIHFVPEAVIYIRYRDSLYSLYRQARNYAQYNVLLYKLYRKQGMAALPRKNPLRDLIRILKKFTRARSKAALAMCIWQYGWYIGRLKGSLRYAIWAV